MQFLRKFDYINTNSLDSNITLQLSVSLILMGDLLRSSRIAPHPYHKQKYLVLKEAKCNSSISYEREI